MSDKRKLMIVEDDVGLQRQLRWNFEDYEVHTASNRDEAMQYLVDMKPPVVTVDLGLPPDPDGATEGLATVEKILSAAPDTKVIVVTGNEEREHALKAISLGAYDFYQKPINADILGLIIQRAFHLFELEDENRPIS